MKITTGTLLTLAVYVNLRATSYVFNPRPYPYIHFIVDLVVVIGIVITTRMAKT